MGLKYSVSGVKEKMAYINKYGSNETVYNDIGTAYSLCIWEHVHLSLMNLSIAAVINFATSEALHSSLAEEMQSGEK